MHSRRAAELYPEFTRKNVVKGQVVPFQDFVVVARRIVAVRENTGPEIARPIVSQYKDIGILSLADFVSRELVESTGQ